MSDFLVADKQLSTGFLISQTRLKKIRDAVDGLGKYGHVLNKIVYGDKATEKFNESDVNDLKLLMPCWADFREFYEDINIIVNENDVVEKYKEQNAGKVMENALSIINATIADACGKFVQSSVSKSSINLSGVADNDSVSSLSNLEKRVNEEIVMENQTCNTSLEEMPDQLKTPAKHERDFISCSQISDDGDEENNVMDAEDKCPNAPKKRKLGSSENGIESLKETQKAFFNNL